MKNSSAKKDKDLKVNSGKTMKVTLEIAIITLFVIIAVLLAVLFLYTPSVGNDIPFVL